MVSLTEEVTVAGTVRRSIAAIFQGGRPFTSVPRKLPSTWLLRPLARRSRNLETIDHQPPHDALAGLEVKPFTPVPALLPSSWIDRFALVPCASVFHDVPGWV